MNRRAEFVVYQPKTILNKSKRADHFFWSRYSAYPYIGCQHGCAFCYCRERKFCPYDEAADFAYVIKVKENAAQLLRRALSRAPVDVVFTGDYQPLERKFKISQQMLEVCYDLGFPIFILERSPLVLRDLELIQAIHAKSRAVVAFSIISTPDSPHYERACQMERLAPRPEKRFAAMEKIAAAGIVTGACCMPILPGICDDEANLEAVVRWTKEHGGSFVLVGGLTLADQQGEFFLDFLRQRMPDLLSLYQQLYPPGSYASTGGWWLNIARRVRAFCQHYGIADRVPRPIIPTDKRAVNKRVAEILADKVYTLELNGAAQQRIWAYRKAAWAVDDLEQDIRLVYNTLGLKGLQSIPDIGPSIAKEVEKLIIG